MTLFYKFSMFMFVVIFFTICLVVYWIVYPYKTVVFNKEEFEITTPVVKQGGFVHYLNDYCKFIDLPAKVTRSFINGLIYVSPSTIVNRPKGCNSFDIAVKIPEELPPGKYQMEMSYQYQINPVRVITIKHNTEEFEVREATPSAK